MGLGIQKPRGSKYSIFEVSGLKKDIVDCVWDQTSQLFGTSSPLREMDIGPAWCRGPQNDQDHSPIFLLCS